MRLSKMPKVIIQGLPPSVIQSSSTYSIEELGVISTDFDQFMETIRAVLRSKISSGPKNKLLKFTILAGNFDIEEPQFVGSAPSMMTKVRVLPFTAKDFDLNALHVEPKVTSSTLYHGRKISNSSNL
jgi:hypothetical protein